MKSELAFSPLRRYVWVVVVAIVTPVLISWLSRSDHKSPRRDSIPYSGNTSHSTICSDLATSLPGAVFSQPHDGFWDSLDSYHSVQEVEIIPQCIVKPHNASEVSVAVKILRRHYDLQSRPGATGEHVRFAVRSGGHAPEAGFANVEGGVVIDLSWIDEVVVSDDRTQTMIGSGARWGDVYRRLDMLGVAVAGGRSADVGVGGLAWGGGVSFFSPQVGLVCNNIIEYEIVLADGTITTASAWQNPDLWRALKGGTGNFGVVTRFTAYTFPAGKVWQGTVYAASWKAPQFLKALHEYGAVAKQDESAAGPIMAFRYSQILGFSAIWTFVTYTKPQKWPACFEAFRNAGRPWSKSKIKTLSDAAKEQSAAVAGNRQFQVTTTIQTDLETMEGALAVFRESIGTVRGVKDLFWGLVLQPLSEQALTKGSVNSLGLSTRNSTIVIVLLTCFWSKREDNDLAERTARSVI